MTILSSVIQVSFRIIHEKLVHIAALVGFVSRALFRHRAGGGLVILAHLLHAQQTGARIFGNILDPDSEVSHILREKRVFIQLKEEMGTSPRFFYYFDK